MYARYNTRMTWDSIESKRDIEVKKDGGSRSECIVQADRYDNEHVGRELVNDGN